MDLQPNDFDRLVFFEHARKAAEAAYAVNPLDADVRDIPRFVLFLSRLFGLFQRVDQLDSIESLVFLTYSVLP